jgi:hypothetical protein
MAAVDVNTVKEEHMEVDICIKGAPEALHALTYYGKLLRAHKNSLCG